jgi:DNA-directed RNA polymerase subunit RPC12/RpoP
MSSIEKGDLLQCQYCGGSAISKHKNTIDEIIETATISCRECCASSQLHNCNQRTETEKRLTAIATKHATRADELYETLERVCSYLSEDGLITTGLEKDIVNAQTLLRKRAAIDSNGD